MNIREYRNTFIAQLADLYDPGEAESIFYLLLEAFSNLKKIDLSLQPDLTFTAEESAKYDTALSRLKQHEPVQHIIGSAHFFGLEFEVNSNVLVPRPETEELVDWIISENAGSGEIRILDIGTGSGCIAVSLAKHLPQATVSAMDISVKALEVAKRNAERHQVRINFIQSDVLKLEKLPENFDLIVSNPPYVRNLEKAEMRQNVLEYDPELALFVSDDDPLVFYRKISELAKDHLPENGKLYFEINQYLGPEMIALLQKSGFATVALRKDIYGNDRMLEGRKSNS